MTANMVISFKKKCSSNNPQKRSFSHGVGPWDMHFFLYKGGVECGGFPRFHFVSEASLIILLIILTNHPKAPEIEITPDLGAKNRKSTVDGRINPAPVGVGSLSRYLQGFIYIYTYITCGAGFLPSTVLPKNHRFFPKSYIFCCRDLSDLLSIQCFLRSHNYKRSDVTIMTTNHVFRLASATCNMCIQTNCEVVPMKSNNLQRLATLKKNVYNFLISKLFKTFQSSKRIQIFLPRSSVTHTQFIIQTSPRWLTVP